MTAIPLRFTKTASASLLVMLGLGACAGSPYDINARQCSPAEHQALVGRNIGEIMLPPTLRTREVWPNGAAPQNTNPARLTMYLDEKGWVRRVACG
ncbi:hypothetical protein [Paracoccus sp. (in: a-proteobacteria)]|uniref:hypothetical protein n=1 Tax=Paracoccus sp. TaxID=267 RepID=UPI00396C6AE0